MNRISPFFLSLLLFILPIISKPSFVRSQEKPRYDPTTGKDLKPPPYMGPDEKPTPVYGIPTDADGFEESKEKPTPVGGIPTDVQGPENQPTSIPNTQTSVPQIKGETVVISPTIPKNTNTENKSTQSQQKKEDTNGFQEGRPNLVEEATEKEPAFSEQSREFTDEEVGPENPCAVNLGCVKREHGSNHEIWATGAIYGQCFKDAADKDWIVLYSLGNNLAWKDYDIRKVRFDAPLYNPFMHTDPHYEKVAIINRKSVSLLLCVSDLKGMLAGKAGEFLAKKTKIWLSY